MSIEKLAALRRGAVVEFDAPKSGVIARGTVNARDEQCVEIWWPDGTSSVIWFAHCRDGRDNRHRFLFAAPKKRRAKD